MPTTCEAVTEVPREGSHWSHTYIGETIRDISEFDALEVHGQVDIDGDISDLNDETPEYFGLYAHRISGGGLECIGDFAALEDATLTGDRMSELIGWPLAVCCSDLPEVDMELPLAS